MRKKSPIGVADCAFQVTATEVWFVGATLSVKARCAPAGMQKNKTAAATSAGKMMICVAGFMAGR